MSAIKRTRTDKAYGRFLTFQLVARQTIMTRQRFYAVIEVLPAMALLACLPAAQAQVDPTNERQWNVADGDYGDPNNWDDPNFAPPEARFGEGAVISNMGTANVNGIIPSAVDGSIEATPGGLRVTDGVLNISATGQLRVVADATAPGPPVGAASFTGASVLRIASGGVFEADTLQLTSAFEPTITGSGFTPINVTGTASLGGDLDVTFSGFTPSTTDTWTLAEADALGGGFGSITATGITLLTGQFLDVRAIDAGGGRVAAELFVDQLVTLEVDRLTRSVKMFSSSGVPIDIDGYTITSASGALNSSDGAWNSLTEQVGGNWRESNPSANHIGELKQTGDSSIDGAGIVLGNIYAPPPAPGFRMLAPGAEDLRFNYTSSDGTTRRGTVEYTGEIINDLLLLVDPASGQVQLRNPSGFDVAIEGYSITSESGALVPGGWNSLDDADGPGNNDGGWRESNASSGFLAELLQTGEEMVQDGTIFDLGTIYDFSSAAEDLVFEFLLAGDSQSLVGTILYDTITSLPGDFNGDGKVNGADFLEWQRNQSVGNLSDWRANYGAPANGTLVSAAVPEPSTLVFFALSMAGWACGFGNSARRD